MIRLTSSQPSKPSVTTVRAAADGGDRIAWVTRWIYLTLAAGGAIAAFVVYAQMPARLKRWLGRVGRRLIGRPVTAASIAVLSLAIGGVLAVWPSTISDATALAIEGPNRSAINWYVVVFWFVVLLWTVMLYLRMRHDDRKEQARVDELIGAIWRAPNYKAVISYRELFRQVAEYLTDIRASEDEAKIADRIRGALILVANLARTFRGAAADVRYGANIMLVVRPDEKVPDCYAREVLDALRFVDRDNAKLCNLSGILYLPEALLYHSSVDGDATRVPVIALPVPGAPTDGLGHMIALPGAPLALLQGGASVYEDARGMSALCGDMSASVRDQVAEYFSSTGDGRMLGSLVSFRIGNEREPVGILNIDCAERNLLGDSSEYYPTFYALMAPILQLLADPVNRYARLASW